jgi:predicted nuclease with TOPRIM domain
MNRRHCERQVMDINQLQIEEVDQLLHAVEKRVESLTLGLEKLDRTKDADACHALEEQLRALNDQQRFLSKRWRELAAGYSDT